MYGASNGRGGEVSFVASTGLFFHTVQYTGVDGFLLLVPILVDLLPVATSR